MDVSAPTCPRCGVEMHPLAADPGNPLAGPDGVLCFACVVDTPEDTEEHWPLATLRVYRPDGSTAVARITRPALGGFSVLIQGQVDAEHFSVRYPSLAGALAVLVGFAQHCIISDGYPPKEPN